MAQRIKEAGIARVSVSLDGASPETHDTLRGLPGSFAQACQGLQNLHSIGVPTQVNSTITRMNQHEMDKLYEVTGMVGASALHLFMLVPVGCGAELEDNLRLGPGEQERILNWLYDRQIEGDIFCKATCAPQYHRILKRRAEKEGRDLDLKTHGMSATTKGCLAGSGVCFVSHDGEVFPCGYLPKTAGNILHKPLKDIWMNSDLFAQLRDEQQLTGRCGACEYKSDCSGCRARALAVHGDLMAEEPGCAWVPESLRS